MVLTDQQKQDFMRDGYIILREAIPRDLLIATRKLVNKAYKQNKWSVKGPWDVALHFDEDVQSAPEIPALVSNTCLAEALEDLLGKGNAKWGKKCQIAFRIKDKKLIRQGVTLTQPMDKLKYHVDGGNGATRHNGTPFAILMGVCLSPGQMKDENRGQLNVWPGSHLQLHEIIKDRCKKGLIDGPNTLHCEDGKNIDVGDPIRVRLRPGDVVIAHQRLGHSGGINLVDQIRKNLYYRVKSKKHNDMMDEIVHGSPFAEFEGLHEMIGYVKPDWAK